MDEQTFEEIKELASRVDKSIAMAVMTERGIEDNQENWNAFWEAAPDEPDEFWNVLMDAHYNILVHIYGEDIYTKFMEREYPEP